MALRYYHSHVYVAQPDESAPISFYISRRSVLKFTFEWKIHQELYWLTMWASKLYASITSDILLLLIYI